MQAVASDWRTRVDEFLNIPLIQHSIIGLIILNAIILGLETVPSFHPDTIKVLSAIDRVILGVFIIEIVLRIFVKGWRFFKDPWNLFDFLVVSIALIPATGSLAVLRALRVLRVLRLLTVVPSMKKVIGALMSAIPGLSSIGLVLMIIFYVFAVIGTKLFAETFPQWFGDLGNSFYTLFQVMTLESWSMGIARPVMEQHPGAWAFFIPFILVATFTMLNLFIAIIVNAMQTFSESGQAEIVEKVDDARVHIEDNLHEEIKCLRSEISEIKALLSKR